MTLVRLNWRWGHDPVHIDAHEQRKEELVVFLALGTELDVSFDALHGGGNGKAQ